MTTVIIEGSIPPFGREPWGKDAIEVEDGGQALIATLGDSEDEGLFVKIQSWTNLLDRYKYDDSALATMHPDFAELAGKRVRVTIEVIDDKEVK